MSSEKLNAAINSIEAGDKTAAMRILAEIVTTDPKNEMAWFWLSKCVEEIDRKRYCLARALSINPNSTRTRQALIELESLSQPTYTNHVDAPSEPPQQSEPIPETPKTPLSLELVEKDQPKQERSSVPILIIAILLLCACVYVFVMRGGTPSASVTTRTDRSEAVYAWASAKILVSNKLKAPSTAKYPDNCWNGECVTPLGNYRYMVKNYVDAQNSFGAMIRTTFVVIVVDKGTEWVLESADFF